MAAVLLLLAHGVALTIGGFACIVAVPSEWSRRKRKRAVLVGRGVFLAGLSFLGYAVYLIYQ